jgi:hypothetical protein
MHMTEAQQYIEHEVQLRVLKEMQESKFMAINERFMGVDSANSVRFDGMEKATSARFDGVDKELLRIDAKINWVLGINVTCIFLSIFLKVIGAF